MLCEKREALQQGGRQDDPTSPSLAATAGAKQAHDGEVSGARPKPAHDVGKRLTALDIGSMREDWRRAGASMQLGQKRACVE